MERRSGEPHNLHPKVVTAYKHWHFRRRVHLASARSHLLVRSCHSADLGQIGGPAHRDASRIVCESCK